MAYEPLFGKSYNGLAGIWGHGKLPTITIDSIQLPARPDYYSYSYRRKLPKIMSPAYYKLWDRRLTKSNIFPVWYPKATILS